MKQTSILTECHAPWLTGWWFQAYYPAYCWWDCDSWSPSDWARVLNHQPVSGCEKNSIMCTSYLQEPPLLVEVDQTTPRKTLTNRLNQFVISSGWCCHVALTSRGKNHGWAAERAVWWWLPPTRSRPVENLKWSHSNGKMEAMIGATNVWHCLLFWLKFIQLLGRKQMLHHSQSRRSERKLTCCFMKHILKTCPCFRSVNKGFALWWDPSTYITYICWSLLICESMLIYFEFPAAQWWDLNSNGHLTEVTPIQADDIPRCVPGRSKSSWNQCWSKKDWDISNPPTKRSFSCATWPHRNHGCVGDVHIWQCVKSLYPFCSHQNSWDLWMFIPLKMVFS